MAARPRARQGQTLIWRVTAFTGLGLVVLLAAHMIAHHFVVESVGGLRTYDQVLDYLANPVMFVIECLFLGFVTVHAMLGLRSVLFDLTTNARTRAWISRGLVALGALTLTYGLLLVGILASRS
jgi:succinate dehydrogenase hydrophobic anchor subunit